MIKGLGFEELADDLLFPSPGTIPVLSSHQNRGVTIGYAGLLCATHNPTSCGIAEPYLILGTKRYGSILVTLILLENSQACAARFQAPFSDLPGDFATRQEFAKKSSTN